MTQHKIWAQTPEGTREWVEDQPAGWGLKFQPIPEITDCNAIPYTGTFNVATGADNAPAGSIAGTLIHNGKVITTSGNYYDSQIYVDWNGYSWNRSRKQNIWGDWHRTLDERTGWGLVNTPQASRNLDNTAIPSSIDWVDAQTSTGVPTGAKDGAFEQIGVNSPTYRIQRYTDYKGSMYIRTREAGVWGQWKEFTDGRVSIKGTRDTAGSWTITGLTPYKPLYLLSKANADGTNLMYRVTAGSDNNAGSSPSTTRAYSFSTSSVADYGFPLSSTIIPNTTTVTIEIINNNNMILFAYQ